MHCFYTSTFSTSCFLSPVMDGKIEQCVCIKLGKSATETLEMLHELWGNTLDSEF
jgi:hypothetical protein